MHHVSICLLFQGPLHQGVTGGGGGASVLLSFVPSPHTLQDVRHLILHCSTYSTEVKGQSIQNLPILVMVLLSAVVSENQQQIQSDTFQSKSVFYILLNSVSRNGGKTRQEGPSATLYLSAGCQSHSTVIRLNVVLGDSLTDWA